MTRRSNAKRDEGRSVLPEGEGQGSVAGKGGADLSKVDGASAGNGTPTEIVAAQTAAKSEDLKISELIPATIREEIRHARGNLVLASSRLGVSVSRLDRVLQLAPKILMFAGELQRVSKEKEEKNKLYLKAHVEQVEEELARRAILYRSEALDAIRDLATMPLSDNSAQNQVKLAAAIRLYGETKEKAIGEEIQATLLQALNKDFHEKAPRLRSIRQTTVTFEDGAPQQPAIEGTATAVD